MHGSHLSPLRSLALFDDGLGARAPGLLRSLRTCAQGSGLVALTVVLDEPEGPKVLTWPASALRDPQVAAAPGREALDKGAVVVRGVGRDELAALGIDPAVRACAAVPVQVGEAGARAAVTAWSRSHPSPELVTQAEVVAELLEGPLARVTRRHDPWERYARLAPQLDALELGVVILDPLGIVRVWSPGASRATGLPAELALDRALTALGLALPPLLQGGARALLVELRGGQRERVVTQGPPRADGRHLEWTLSAAPQGEAVVALVREAPAASADGAGPCGALAHELNNVLTSILLSAELVGASIADDQPGGDHLKRLLGSTRRAASLGTLLTMASGCPGVPGEAVDLAPIVDEVVAQARAALPAGCELELVLSGGALATCGDERQLALAAQALVDNAVEALRDRPGTVTVHVEVLDPGPGEGPAPALRRGGRFVRLVVGDDGPGMDEDTLARCTRPFYTTRPARLGLGLAAVQGLADAAGGALVVHSRAGSGTRAELWLPAGA